MDYEHRLDYVESELEDARRAGLYRKLVRARADGARIAIGSKSLINLCSNDYLGMPPSTMPQGQLQSSSRLVSGSDESHHSLEESLARHKSQQAALVYPTGYMANMGAVSALAKKGDLILSDALNHASIIDACRCSGATVSVYGHNDMDDLESKIRQDAQNKFIISEGIFSMDGDYADLDGLGRISRNAGAITILDDAHGDFAVGESGAGTPEALGGIVDVYVSSLSKGLGSFGGYVASTASVINLCINRSRQFIYTSALPRQLAEHASTRLNSDRLQYQKILHKNTARLSRGLKDLGYDVGDTHIMPVIIGGEKETVQFAESLRGQGVFAQPIRYPTVPRGQARIRISATAWLSQEDVDHAIGAFEAARNTIS